MAEISFYPDYKSIIVPDGTTILHAARLAGVILESPCNGAGTCGKCKVQVDSESLHNIVSSGRHHLSAEEAAQGFVLSCETKIYGNVKVHILQKQKNKTLKILSKGESFKITVSPCVRKEYDIYEHITRVFFGESISGIEEGDTTRFNYGIVVDIGTTTLVTALINLNDGEELETESSLNPQALHAQDVLSRIKFASEEKGLEVMYTSLVEEINRMIGEVSRRSGVLCKNIYEIVLSGNTCMLHLVSNTNPESLGKYPYTPLIKESTYLKASEYNLGISPFGLIYLPPIISAYVGADITSGVLASSLHNKKGVTFFVDIGTNGEMVIGLNGKLSATSTAAGPAFEGMNITHGMRAGEGAVEAFEIDETWEVKTKVIGGTKAIGICGSGLLDIVGELVDHGVINRNGKFVEPESENIAPILRERLVRKDGKLVFRVSDEVFLSQKDIRQVQLAKGAVRAGIEFLMKSKGVEAHEVDRVLIAGSFGYHLRAKSLINIGLLPQEFLGKIEFIGNTSKSGGQALLLNKGYRTLMDKVVKDIEVLELANYKDFDKVFVKSLSF